MLDGSLRLVLIGVLIGFGLGSCRSSLSFAPILGVNRGDLRSRGVASRVHLLDRLLELTLLGLELLRLLRIRGFEGGELAGLRFRGRLFVRLFAHQGIRLGFQLRHLLAHGTLAGLTVLRRRRLLLDLLKRRGFLADRGPRGRDGIIEVLRRARADHEVPGGRQRVSAVLRASDGSQILASGRDRFLARIDFLLDRRQLRLSRLKLACNDLLLPGCGGQLGPSGCQIGFGHGNLGLGLLKSKIDILQVGVHAFERGLVVLNLALLLLLLLQQIVTLVCLRGGRHADDESGRREGAYEAGAFK